MKSSLSQKGIALVNQQIHQIYPFIMVHTRAKSSTSWLKMKTTGDKKMSTMMGWNCHFFDGSDQEAQVRNFTDAYSQARIIQQGRKLPQ